MQQQPQPTLQLPVLQQQAKLFTQPQMSGTAQPMHTHMQPPSRMPPSHALSTSLQQLHPSAHYGAMQAPAFTPLYPQNGMFMQPNTLQQQQMWMQQQQQMLYSQQQAAAAAAASPFNGYGGMAMTSYSPASFLQPQPLTSPQLPLHTQPAASPPASAPPSPSSMQQQQLQQLQQQQQQQQLQAQGGARLSARCPLCANVFAYGADLAASAGPVGADVLCPFCRQAVRLPPPGLTIPQAIATPLLPSSTNAANAAGATMPAAAAPPPQQQHHQQQQSALAHQQAVSSAAAAAAAAAASIQEQADQEAAYYTMLAPYATDFENPHSALVWLSRATPSRTGKLAVPRTHRNPKSSSGQGGYCVAFQTLGLVLRESDTSTGHWHSWYAEPRRVSLKPLQAALLRRWREAPGFKEAFLLMEPGAQMDQSESTSNNTAANAAQAVDSGAAALHAQTELTPASQARSISAADDSAGRAPLSSSSASLAAPPSSSAAAPVLPEAPAAPDVGSASDDGTAAADVTSALAAIFQANSAGHASTTSPSFPARAWALKDSTLLACIRAARQYNAELATSRGARIQASTSMLASPISALTHHPLLESPAPLLPPASAVNADGDSAMLDPMASPAAPQLQRPSLKRKDAPDEAASEIPSTASEIPPTNTAVVASTTSPTIADGLLSPPILQSGEPSRQTSISSASFSSPGLLGFGSDFVPSSLSSAVSPSLNSPSSNSAALEPSMMPGSPLVGNALVSPVSVGLNKGKPPTGASDSLDLRKQAHKKRAISGADDSPESAHRMDAVSAKPADRSASRSSSSSPSSGHLFSPSPALPGSSAAPVHPLLVMESAPTPLDVRLRGGDSAASNATAAADSPSMADSSSSSAETTKSSREAEAAEVAPSQPTN